MLLAALAAGCGSSNTSGTTAASATPASELAPIAHPYSPSIDPARFVSTIDNPYFPLQPGSVRHTRGVAEDGTTPMTGTTTVTDRTKQIAGIEATVVKDTVNLGGKPEERTFDWYAQDDQGNVWYLGEDSADYRHGRWVPSDGSWETGVNGAQPGIVMPAIPQAGEAYRQEFYSGHAEDLARGLGSGGALTVPYDSYPNTIKIHEWTPLEPGVAEDKYYARGIGEISSVMVKGGKERSSLVSFTP